MTSDEELTATTRHHHADSALLRFGKQRQFGSRQDVVAMQFGMTAMRHHEQIVEPTEDGQLWLEHLLWEDAEHLLLERILRYAIMEIESCLRRPADVHCAPHVRTGPLENVLHLVPIGDVLEVKCLDGRTGDNHAVIFLVAHLFEVAVEHHHMFDGRILRRMAAEFHETDFQLQRCIRQQTYQVGLCRNLQRHEVQDGNLQRTDVLIMGTRIVHHKDVLMLQQFYGR